MNRDAYLNERLVRFLTERRTPPRTLVTDEARAKEMKALLRIVLSRAPHGDDDFEAWWEDVERHVGANANTRAWPTEKELLAATFSATVPGQGTRKAPEWKLDPMAVAARRIRSGEAVGDERIYGRLAVQLLADGHVTEADLRPYRVALYHGFKSAWGEEKADEEVATRQRMHRTSEAVHRGDADFFARGDGDGTIRPRMMPGMVPARDWQAEPDAPPAFSDAPRPYTDAERARMRRLHGLDDDAQEATA